MAVSRAGAPGTGGRREGAGSAGGDDALITNVADFLITTPPDGAPDLLFHRWIPPGGGPGLVLAHHGCPGGAGVVGPNERA